MRLLAPLRRPHRSARTLLIAACLLTLGTLGPVLAVDSASAQKNEGRCQEENRSLAGTNCQEGNGRQVAGGGDKVSHAGWPKVTGLLWIAETAGSRTYNGTPDNDELLSHHASDTVNGGDGHDIIWGDWDPSNNTTKQRDVLNGDGGNDWIYASHGRNTLRGGAGNDFIYAYYGHGTIDCGKGGGDTAKIRLGTGQYKVKGCERILNFCAFGSIGGKRCAKPGEKARASTQR